VEHPDEDVDVLCISLTELLQERDELEWPVPWSLWSFADDDSRIGVGALLMAIGFPAVLDLEDGRVPLLDGSTFHGVLKSGIAATDPLKSLVDLAGGRTYRGFLIDGLTLPGMSGSPVFSAERRFAVKPGAPNRAEDPGGLLDFIDPRRTLPPILLGVIAETRFAELEAQRSFAGYGLAYAASTIAEIVELMHST
jgi:hypothetical protein